MFKNASMKSKPSDWKKKPTAEPRRREDKEKKEMKMANSGPHSGQQGEVLKSHEFSTEKRKDTPMEKSEEKFHSPEDSEYSSRLMKHR